MTIKEDPASRKTRMASARIASGKSERGAWMNACASSDDDLRG